MTRILTRWVPLEHRCAAPDCEPIAIEQTLVVNPEREVWRLNWRDTQRWLRVDRDFLAGLRAFDRPEPWYRRLFRRLEKLTA